MTNATEFELKLLIGDYIYTCCYMEYFYTNIFILRRVKRRDQRDRQRLDPPSGENNQGAIMLYKELTLYPHRNIFLLKKGIN